MSFCLGPGLADSKWQSDCFAVYASTKAAVDCLVKYAAIEAAPDGESPLLHATRSVKCASNANRLCGAYFFTTGMCMHSLVRPEREHV